LQITVWVYKGMGVAFSIALKVTKRSRPEASTLTCSTREQLSLLYDKVSIAMHGPENPGDIPKIRKLAALKQYEFLNGISPGFSPAERFFQQRPKGYERYEGYRGHHLIGHYFCKIRWSGSLQLPKVINSNE